MEKHLANIVYVLVLNLILVLQRQEHKKQVLCLEGQATRNPPSVQNMRG